MWHEEIPLHIYKTTHIDSGKFYNGKHSTDIIEDGYLGSGVYVNRAIDKYGRDRFERTILEFASSFEELNELEARYITDEMISSDMCYNFAPGGLGGTTKEMWTYGRKQHHSDVMSVVNNREDKKIATSKTVSELHSELGKDYWSPEGFESMTKNFRENASYYAKMNIWTDEKKEAHSKVLLASEKVGRWERTPEDNARMSRDRQGQWTGDKNPAKSVEGRQKIRDRRTNTKMLVDPEGKKRYVHLFDIPQKLHLGYSYPPRKN